MFGRLKIGTKILLVTGAIAITVIVTIGVVSDLSRRVWHEFQHDLANQAGSNELEAELTKGSVFQKAVQLPAGRYKVEIIAKDMVSGRLGISQAALNLPAATGLLELSPLVLADLVTFRGPIYQMVTRSESASSMAMASLAIVMQAVVLTALAIRSVHRIWRISIASLILAALYTTSLVVAYHFTY